MPFADLDGIAVAAGPGLIGGVLMGLVTAKALALVTRKPLIAVNHLEAHALTARLTDGIGLPLPPAARLRRAHAARRREGRRRLCAPRRHHRRRYRRGVRQGRQAPRARLSGRAGGRARWRARQLRAFRLAAPDARATEAELLPLRAEDGAAASRRNASRPRPGATSPTSARASRRRWSTWSWTAARRAARLRMQWSDTRPRWSPRAASPPTKRLRRALKRLAGEAGLAFDRAAAGPLRRQRRHDRLGRP